MAVTGLVMLLFLAAHVAGNLLVFRGPAELDAYTAFLKHDPILLWLVRLTLLGAIVLHSIAAYQLARIDRAARTKRYTNLKPQSATFASRTMRTGGVIIAAFVIFHLLHLTTGTVAPASYVDTLVYANVVGGFQVWWVSAIYLVALIAIGLHLYHGAWSWLRTLGLSRNTGAPLHRPIATVLALVIWAGFSSIPLAVLFGMLK
jgi:succinate dehydrogenase / fumarate reductase cytochrome b subunit